MATRNNFTTDRIASFKCNANSKQTIYWDAKTRGLGLRVTAAGAKSYIFETKLHGKTIRITIGDVSNYSISKAQEVATEYKTLTNKGIDPREQKQALKTAANIARTEQQRQLITFGDLWPVYLEENKASWGDRHYKDHLSLSSIGGASIERGGGVTIPGPINALSSLRLTEITNERIAKWLEAESITRPTRAALSFRLVRAFIRWANSNKAYKGMIESEAYTASNVRKAIHKGIAKVDCLQREQLPIWFEEVRKLSNPVISAYLQCLLITGARREELTGLRWEHIDFKWKSLTLRDKVDGQRIIPLTPYVASLLQGLKQLSAIPPSKRYLNKLAATGGVWTPSPWVFFSLTAVEGRLAEPRAAHVKALASAGLPHLSIHGLRRSFGTLCEWVEMPAGISAQIMGHKPSAIAEKHYRQRPLDLLRMWHEKIEVWILGQAGIIFDSPLANKPLLLATYANGN
jgi:integrase